MMTTAKTWRMRTSVATLGAAMAVAAVLGPPQTFTTRLSAGETIGFATVSAADTIVSTAVLAEVPAAGVS